MSKCAYPQHHDASGGGSVLAVLAAAALAVYVAVRVVLAVVHFVEAWWWVPVLVFAAAVVTMVTGRFVTRHERVRPSAPRWLRHLPRAVWAAARWHALTRRLNLAVPDRHRKGRVLRLRAVIWPTCHGVAASVRCVPGSGREQVEAAAIGIADSWRCVRVSVNQRKPGRLAVRGMRTDPLTMPVAAGILPPWDRRHLVLGPDEWAAVRSADLANLSGSVISGNPGRGKTESALSMAIQLVPSDAVELWLMDGGGSDWAPFVPAAVASCDDNLADAEELLLELHSQMMTRRRNLEADTGYRNGWKAGPSEKVPFRWLLIEECSVFFDLEAVRGDRDRERRVRACRGLVGQLLRRGRAPMHHTTLVIQKPVGAGGLPPELRDLCGLRWSFGLSTLESAVAALGDDVRQFPAMNPALLQEPQHVGTAVALMRSGMSPYTFIKFPEIGEALADRVAEQAAARRVSRAVPDDVSELVDS